MPRERSGTWPPERVRTRTSTSWIARTWESAIPTMTMLFYQEIDGVLGGGEWAMLQFQFSKARLSTSPRSKKCSVVYLSRQHAECFRQRFEQWDRLGDRAQRSFRYTACLWCVEFGERALQFESGGKSRSFRNRQPLWHADDRQRKNLSGHYQRHCSVWLAEALTGHPRPGCFVRVPVQA